jgi:hypothetical protein
MSTVFRILLTTNQVHGGEFLTTIKSLSYSRTSQNVMEPEGTLLCSQEPSTGPYPESEYT